MRVPLSWLRDFAPFEGDPVALGETFDDLGMVVEGIERVGEGLDGVVVARVLEVHRIEGADKIRRVLVDDGTGDAVQVVCGAWNFEAGAVVPFARVGAVLPGDFAIGRRKMKGVESNGMICSARELSMGEDGAGIMVLADDVAPGTPFADAMGIQADVVFDLAIETNRPDANSVAGVARDAAARLKLPFTLPSGSLPGGAPTASASARVESPDLCPRFTATVVTDVVVGDSPEWVRRRLTLAGMRPINNVVDASNYVMLELGQPTHPYDLDQLGGQGLLVRAARPGEKLVTLDGVERTLGTVGEDCLICDALDVPVGIAGIMGGESSEISATTTRVLLEAAYFAPMAIARTSKRLGLRSEASARFERGCDPDGIDRSVARFCQVAGVGQVDGGAIDVRSLPAARPAIRVRTERVNKVLGTALSTEEIASYLEPIGFEVARANGAADVAAVLDVVPPSFRPDVSIEENVIEEVARHHGYMNIERTIPRRPFVGSLTPYQKARRRLREVLVGAGLSEALGVPLLAPGEHAKAGLAEKALSAPDPLAREESVLRTSVLPGLLRAVAFNQSHRVADVALFEIGHVFGVPAEDSQPLPDEREVLGAVVADAVAAKRVFDVVSQTFHSSVSLASVADAPGLHPTRSAAVSIDGVGVVGHVGEVDPGVLAGWGIEGRVGWIGLDLGAFLPVTPVYRAARPVSRFPSSDIDLAFVVPDTVPAAAVHDALYAAAGDLLQSVALFDVYRDPERLGEGRRSLAYRLRFQSQDRTLTDEDVAAVRARLIDAIESGLGASLRG
ncbi:MAG: phenylalanyl-tRNA synthetase beta chain [Acidimicrobiaceae bacterium]|jgi:phenylalanyl-tRNA synthetase beta chain|nr:phenylalanyl-tRNA synthetase beta chain [Acidimicrobiaceae bacterium]